MKAMILAGSRIIEIVEQLAPALYHPAALSILCALFIQPAGLIRSTIALKPSTLSNLLQAQIKSKYRILMSP
jgi:hypothetical protein